MHEPYNHEVKMSREIVIEIGDKQGVDSFPGVALVIIGRWGGYRNGETSRDRHVALLLGERDVVSGIR